MDTYEFPGKPDHRVLIRLNLLFFLCKELIGDVEEDNTQDIEKKMESLHQGNPGKDENSPEEYGTKNTPEQDLPLRFPGHRKIGEKCQEDKHVIYTQGVLNQVGGKEGKPLFRSLREGDKGTE